MLRLYWLVCLIPLAFLNACQGQPPTAVYIVVTATAEATPTAQTIETSTAAQNTATSAVTPIPLTATFTPGATPTVDVFPTPVLTRIQVAEQVFERGRMFWIEPQRKIWVIVDNGSGSGTWSVFDDTFADGQPESDPSLIPPQGLFQPLRGFGKLWRENPQIKDGLGWGLTPEFGYVSNYEYYAGGNVNAQNLYVRGPGRHILYSLYGNEQFQFNEADGTWQKLSS